VRRGTALPRLLWKEIDCAGKAAAPLVRKAVSVEAFGRHSLSEWSNTAYGSQDVPSPHGGKPSWARTGRKSIFDRVFGLVQATVAQMQSQTQARHGRSLISPGGQIVLVSPPRAQRASLPRPTTPYTKGRSSASTKSSRAKNRARRHYVTCVAPVGRKQQCPPPH